jgi:hypothetical protein
MMVLKRDLVSILTNAASYSFAEQIILQKALNSNFNLDVNIHKHGDQYKLYIVAKYMR